MACRPFYTDCIIIVKGKVNLALFLLTAIVLIIIFFSLLTVLEVQVLKFIGFDPKAHLKATYESGQGFKLYFEAIGVFVFVMIQPAFFVCLLIWAFKKLVVHFSL